MAANRRRLVHRLQAGDPLELPASGTNTPWKDKAWQGLAGLTLEDLCDSEKMALGKSILVLGASGL